MSNPLLYPPGALTRRFYRATSAGAATEFALVGLWVILLLFIILNLGLLSFSLGTLAHGVQMAARRAITIAASNAQASSPPTFTCPTPANIAGYFSQYTQAALPSAGTNNASSNPYISATWVDNAATTGVYLKLIGTYKWAPIGLSALGIHAIKLRITTVAFIPGTTNIGTSYTPKIDSASCSASS